MLQNRMIIAVRQKGERMSDLIDRQDAIDAIRKIKARHCETNDDYILLIDKAMAMTELMLLPPAEPEIIRCGDCKWYGRADKRRFYRGMDCLQKRIDTIVPDKDFCSRAERRTDETD